MEQPSDSLEYGSTRTVRCLIGALTYPEHICIRMANGNGLTGMMVMTVLLIINMV